ncbi:response regulator transcription factor [Hymenobacter arizonensis]|uniref:DNA-binding response regulator, NarL/FixJ family, contains REC and HTH domains n=1 Tax=Hymenobacter arizonensis TaxID=1227077 RepID=A0A1I6BEF8_HYMAR|nr:response regulator transcription factor [Hymenobacter arizonensis]SFQ79352.1 DNA-binding response regulator, NarL/FixJ family, contains REC and HTH domains [Hymenobacter arizonensis]
MIRVLVAEPDAAARARRRTQLAGQPGLAVVGEATRARHVVAQLAATPADVLLWHGALGDAAGLDPVRAAHPAVRVLVLGQADRLDRAARLLAAGAAGGVLADAAGAELAQGIRTVAAGRRFVGPSLGLAAWRAAHPAGAPGPSAPPPPGGGAGLSKRETQVLQLVAAGCSNAEIAAQLFTSRRTVETHRQNLRAKTGCVNTAALVRYAVRAGLLG